MMPADRNRTLRLRTETLAELSPADLATIKGAQNYTPIINTVPLTKCLFTDGCWVSADCHTGGPCDPQ